MILLFTDFGWAGPYVGEMRAAIHTRLPVSGPPVIDLMHDSPAFDVRAGAYLLAALADRIPAEAVVVAVVDPGVGGARDPAVLRVRDKDGAARWFVGPNNGLFEPVLRRAQAAQWWRIDPDAAVGGALISDTFHGRDLFGPVGARLAVGDLPDGSANPDLKGLYPDPRWTRRDRRPWAEARPLAEATRPEWPDDLSETIYIDGYGNVMTGLRADGLGEGARMRVGDARLSRKRTFSEAAPGEAFWQRNSTGLVEIVVREGSAAEQLSLSVGASVEVERNG